MARQSAARRNAGSDPMSIEQLVKGWQRGAERDWPEFEARVPQFVERARTGAARHAVALLSPELLKAAIVMPTSVRAGAAPLAAIVDRAVAEENELLPADTLISGIFGTLNLANVLDCVVCSLNAHTRQLLA